MSLLELDHVAVRYGAGRHALTAVDDVSLAVEAGTSIGIVGESGSGKSTLARAIVQLVPTASGRITLDGRDVTGARGSAVRHIRDRVQMVFQDPFASLNPRRTVGATLAEAVSLNDRRASGGGDRPGPGQRAAGAGPAGPRGPAPLPERVQRRPDPAGRHRPGAGRRAAAADPGRGDLRAGRVGAGRDPQPAPRPARAPGPDLPLHLARPVGDRLPVPVCGGDVPGPAGRGRAVRGPVQRAAAPVLPVAARLGPAGPRGADPRHGERGRAQPAVPAARLPVSPPVRRRPAGPARPGGLPAARPASGRRAGRQPERRAGDRAGRRAAAGGSRPATSRWARREHPVRAGRPRGADHHRPARGPGTRSTPSTTPPSAPPSSGSRPTSSSGWPC